jgi:hypothetical protein
VTRTVLSAGVDAATVEGTPGFVHELQAFGTLTFVIETSSSMKPRYCTAPSALTRQRTTRFVATAAVAVNVC